MNPSHLCTGVHIFATELHPSSSISLFERHTQPKIQMASSFSYEGAQFNSQSQQHFQAKLDNESLHGGPEGIAIIGFSLEFPQDATSSERFWKMMAEKRCAMTEFPPDRLNIDAFYHPDSNTGDSFSFRGGHFITKDLAAFDRNFFSITPSDAASMDPAHRRLSQLPHIWACPHSSTLLNFLFTPFKY